MKWIFFERRKKKLNLVYALNGIQSRFISLRFSWSFNLTCFPPFSTWYENGRNWLSLADWDFFIARVSAVSWGSKLIFLTLSILLLIQVLCMWKGSRSFNEIKCRHFGLYEFFIKRGFPPFLVAQITNLSSAKWPTNNVSVLMKLLVGLAKTKLNCWRIAYIWIALPWLNGNNKIKRH